MPDTFVTFVNETHSGIAWNGHDWNKNPLVYLQWLEAFTDSGAVVLDLFSGGATVPAVAKFSGRNYIAFEIDPATADLARERVANTQPPLPGCVPEPEQMTLGMEV